MQVNFNVYQEIVRDNANVKSSISICNVSIEHCRQKETSSLQTSFRNERVPLDAMMKVGEMFD